MLELWFQLSPFSVKHGKNENEFDHDVWKGKEIIPKIMYVVQLCLKKLVCCLFVLESCRRVVPWRESSLSLDKYITMRRTNLCGRAQICRGAAGAGVWQRSTGAAAHWGGRSSASGSFWDAGSLSEDAVPLETGPCVAPAEEEPGQQLNLQWQYERKNTHPFEFEE